jgi:hypothetical protein
VVLTAVSSVDLETAEAKFELDGALTLVSSSGTDLAPLRAGVPNSAAATIRVDSPGEHQVKGSVVFRPDGASSPMKRLTVLYLLAAPEKVWTGIGGFTALKVDRLKDQLSRRAISESEYERELEAIHSGELTSAPPSPTLRDQTPTEKEKRDQEQYDQIKSKFKENSDRESRALEKDPRAIAVTATVKWKDGAGGTHPVRFGRVELINADTNAVITSGQTSVSGGVNLSFSPSASIQNVKLKFYSRAALFALVKSVAGVTYTLETTTPKPTAGVVQGSTAALTFYGIDTNFSSSSTIAFTAADAFLEDTTMTVVDGSVSVEGGTKLIAQVQVAEDAPLGFQKVTITTDGVRETANSTGPELLLVSAPSSSSSAATLASVTPASGKQGGSDTITIVGSNTNFINGTSAVSFSGSGITVLSTTVARVPLNRNADIGPLDPNTGTTSTQLTAEIEIAPNASPGFRDVFVTTGAEVASKLNGFEVVAQVPALSPLGLLVLVAMVSLFLLYGIQRRAA